MESALKGLMLAAGVVLTCIVIGLGFYLAREAKATAAASQDELSSYQQQIRENSLTKYDGLTVSGSDVVNFTKRQLSKYEVDSDDAISIQIITRSHSEVYNSNQYLRELREFTNDRYVDPATFFLCQVSRDENDTICKIIFEQE